MVCLWYDVLVKCLNVFGYAKLVFEASADGSIGKDDMVSKE